MLAFKSSLSNYCCSGELIVPCSPGTLLQFYSCWFLPAWRRKEKKKKEKKRSLSSGSLLHFQPRNFGGTSSTEAEKLQISPLRSKSPLSSANEQPRDRSVNSKTRTRERSLRLVSSLPFHEGLKLKLRRRLSDALLIDPRSWWCQTPLESNWHLWYIVYVG